MQGLNFILPIITLPYLTHVLGPSKYGLISFAQAFIQYFILFTDYGFNLIATKNVSLARDDKQRLSVIFSTVMFVRAALLIFGFLVLLILLHTVPKFQGDSILYLLTFGMVIGNVMFPIWFFQGIEHMKMVSILNVVSKAIPTIGIFLLVKEPSQFLYVPVLNSIGYIAIGIISLYLVTFHYQVRFVIPSKDDVVYQLKEGWHIFVSNVTTSVYTTSNVFILGFFASNTVVGYYAGVERLVKMVLGIITPITQTLYPFLSRSLQESREKTIWILNKAFVVVTVIMGVVSLLIGLNAELLVKFLGPAYTEAVPLVHILCVLPIILGWANILGILTMINFDYQKQLSQIYIVASIVSMILIAILVPTFKEYGTAWNTVITEGLATLLMAIFLARKNIPVWKWQH